MALTISCHFLVPACPFWDGMPKNCIHHLLASFTVYIEFMKQEGGQAGRQGQRKVYPQGQSYDNYGSYRYRYTNNEHCYYNANESYDDNDIL